MTFPNPMSVNDAESSFGRLKLQPHRPEEGFTTTMHTPMPTIVAGTTTMTTNLWATGYLSEIDPCDLSEIDPAPDHAGNTRVILENLESPPFTPPLRLDMWADEARRAALEPLLRSRQRVLMTYIRPDGRMFVESVVPYHGDEPMPLPDLAGVVDSVFPNGGRLRLLLPAGDLGETVDVRLTRPALDAQSTDAYREMCLSFRRQLRNFVEGQIVVAQRCKIHSDGTIWCDDFKVVRPATSQVSVDAPTRAAWTMSAGGVHVPNQSLLFGTCSPRSRTDSGNVALTLLDGRSVDLLMTMRHLCIVHGYGKGTTFHLDCVMLGNGLLATCEPPLPCKTPDRTNTITVGGIAHLNPREHTLAVQYGPADVIAVGGIVDTRGIEDGDIVSVNLRPKDGGGWDTADGSVTLLAA
jgi:hypothetical protein